MVASGVDVVVEEDGVEDSVINGVNADDTDVTVDVYEYVIFDCECRCSVV